MALTGYPLPALALRHLQAGIGSNVIGEMIYRLLNLSGERTKAKIVAGAAAGNVTITGIDPNDRLILVAKHSGVGVVTDLTSEFTISAANTINNTGGTSSAGGYLEVLYGDRTI